MLAWLHLSKCYCLGRGLWTVEDGESDRRTTVLALIHCSLLLTGNERIAASRSCSLVLSVMMDCTLSQISCHPEVASVRVFYHKKKKTRTLKFFQNGILVWFPFSNLTIKCITRPQSASIPVPALIQALGHWQSSWTVMPRAEVSKCRPLYVNSCLLACKHGACWALVGPRLLLFVSTS